VPIIVVLLALAVVALVAGLAAERHLHHWVPRELEQRLHTTFGVDATVLVSGRARDWIRRRGAAHVVIDAVAVPVVNGRSSVDLHVELTDVRLVREASTRRVVAATGSFAARLAADDLPPLLRLPPLIRRVELRNGRVRLLGAAGLSLDMDVALESDQIVLRPRTPIPMRLQLVDPVLRFRLDGLPAGARVTRVQVTAAGVMASGTLDGDRLGPPPGSRDGDG